MNDQRPSLGRMTEDDLRERREFNEERDIDSDGEGGVRE